MNAKHLRHLTDVHCHFIDSPFTPASLSALETKQLILMGTQVLDWPMVENAVTAGKDKALPCFGIHPWFAHHVTTQDLSWLSLLEEKVKKYPGALVGEIGLDGVAKNKQTGKIYPLEHQLDIFSRQFTLACELSRPVSIHSVQVTGKMYDFFKQASREDKFPPAIMMHSYSGSPESAKMLCKLPRIGDRFYFSLSSAVCARSSKLVSRIQGLPEDRILLESDVHDVNLIDSSMLDILEKVADAKSWSLEQAVEKLAQNTARFLEY